MSNLKTMRNAIEQQKIQITLLESAVNELETKDDASENSRLMEELDAIKRILTERQKQVQVSLEENDRLRQELSEMIQLQKNQLVHASRERLMRCLFGTQQGSSYDRLSYFENYAQNRLQQLRVQVDDKQIKTQQELIQQIDSLQQQINVFCSSASGDIRGAYNEEIEKNDSIYDTLRTDPRYVRALLQAHAPQNQAPKSSLKPFSRQKESTDSSLEQKIGEKVTIVAGLLFVVIAVILGLGYTYTYLLQSGILKTGAAYLLGLLFLGTGEWMSRKSRNAFSIGLEAGGIGVLYATTAMAYFNLGVLNQAAALIICIGITALTLFLALKFHSQLIAIFALIGGYLPIFAIDPGSTMILGARFYFFILNLLVLWIAANKEWKLIKFFSFAVHTAGFVFLLLIQAHSYLWLDLCYVCMTYVLYMLISLIYPITQKKAPDAVDSVLTGINTWVQFITVLFLIYFSAYRGWTAAASLLFSALLFIMAKGLKYVLPEHMEIRGMFYATSFAFLGLSIPIQHDPGLYVLGWLFEGCALCIYGLVKSKKWYRYGGWVLLGFSLCAFLNNTLAYSLKLYDSVNSIDYAWRYSCITIAFTLIWVLYHLMESRGCTGLSQDGDKKIWVILQAGVPINIWIYASWITGFFLAYFLPRSDMSYWKFFVQTAYASLIPVLLQRFEKLTVYEKRGLQVIQAIGVALILVLSQRSTAFLSGTTLIVNHVLLISCDLIAALSLRAFLNSEFFLVKGLKKDWKATIIAIFSLILVSQVVVVQYLAGITSIVLSFIYLGSSILFIYLGLRLMYPVFRRFGLILSLGAVTKLFLVDLSFLKSWQRIVSYFVFGFTLIGISYLYQSMSKHNKP